MYYNIIYILVQRTFKEYFRTKCIRYKDLFNCFVVCWLYVNINKTVYNEYKNIFVYIFNLSLFNKSKRTHTTRNNNNK